jgi:hypothetical protein
MIATARFTLSKKSMVAGTSNRRGWRTHAAAIFASIAAASAAVSR